MNKNKGIIGLGLIMVIVLGVTIVGGGAYYLGRNGFKQEVKNPLVDNSQLGKPTSKCMLPSITVLNPNEKETYTLGQTIDIKWASNCIDANKKISIGVDKVVINQDQAVEDMHNIETTNSGSYKWLISKDMPIGQYEIYVTYTLENGYESVSGKSLNLITINSEVSTTSWKTYTNVKHGFSFKYSDTWSQWGNETEAICGLHNGATCATMVDFMDTTSQGIESLDSHDNEVYAPKDHLHVEYHSGSDGSELYQYATSQFQAKQGLYATNSKKIEIAGKTAIVSDIVSNIDGKGKPMIPLRFISVQFLDKNNIGEFDFQFSTPKTNNSTEITNFEKLLTTFKFNN